MKSVQKTTAADQVTIELPPTLNLKPPPTDRLKSEDAEELPSRPLAPKKNAPPINAKIYPVADLQIATNSFSVDSLIGEGSVGRVYRGQFGDGKVI